MQIRIEATRIFVDKQEKRFKALEDSLEALLYSLICNIWGNQPQEIFDEFIKMAREDPDDSRALQEKRWRGLFSEL